MVWYGRMKFEVGRAEIGEKSEIGVSQIWSSGPGFVTRQPTTKMHQQRRVDHQTCEAS